MPPTTVREVSLADRGTVTIRHSDRGDVPGLCALFESLSDRDRHYRFFSPIRPRRALVQRWATLEERGGCGLVATVPEDGGEQIVAEAGYALLGDGTGEFAITVAPGWRGWLGPLLLATLLAQAADRGVANLAADILTDNRAMLGLVGWRGYAATEHTGDRIRVVIPTSGMVPRWPDSLVGPRLVVEAPGARWPAAVQARLTGMNVMVCPGPRGRHGEIHCPELRGGTCPLVEGADGVVVALPGRPSAAATDRDRLVLAHHMHRPDLPVFVVGDTPSAGSAGSAGSVGSAASAGPAAAVPPPFVRPLRAGLSDDEVVAVLQEALGEEQDRTTLVRLLALLRPLTGLLARGHRTRPRGADSAGNVGQRQ